MRERLCRPPPLRTHRECKLMISLRHERVLCWSLRSSTALETLQVKKEARNCSHSLRSSSWRVKVALIKGQRNYAMKIEPFVAREKFSFFAPLFILFLSEKKLLFCIKQKVWFLLTGKAAKNSSEHRSALTLLLFHGNRLRARSGSTNSHYRSRLALQPMPSCGGRAKPHIELFRFSSASHSWVSR